MLYRFHVAYDGTNYHGWQMQDGVPTIAHTLTRTFQNTFHQPASLIGASRTDTGVHAYGQVIRCRTQLEMDPIHLIKVWNQSLPPDIIVRDGFCVDETFHPHVGVEEKTYWYHIFEKRPIPFVARYGQHISSLIRKDVLESCLQLCIGTHDFRSFCTGEYDSTLRTINGIRIVSVPRFGGLRVVIQGPRFLYLMIRRIVGAAVYVASRPALSVHTFQDIFEAKNPAHQLPTAPAKGLLLRKIRYISDDTQG